MMDVSLTQVNGRKFSPAFKCIAFLVLSNTHTHTHTQKFSPAFKCIAFLVLSKHTHTHTHTHTHGKNISEAFGL